MAKKTTWLEKLHDAKGNPKVKPIPQKMQKKWGKGSMLIPAPLEVDAVMASVPEGKLITSNQVRARLAKAHGATMACPMVTGIFAWIASHAAEESRAAGAKKITPYWRTLKTGGELNPKYPGGIDAQMSKLELEGHEVMQKGKKVVVVDYENVLVK